MGKRPSIDLSPISWGSIIKKLHRIYAKVFQENLQSQKVLERCGFKLEGVHKDSVFKHGKWRDIMTYAKINHY